MIADEAISGLLALIILIAVLLLETSCTGYYLSHAQLAVDESKGGAGATVGFYWLPKPNGK